MNLKEKIDNLPKTPGIYMMKDKYGDIIYVGKSKKLKERVKSYFVNSKNHSRKVKRMVKNIKDLDVILTDTELDALILECEMIKKIRPMYNKLLKNYENYSYIKINKKYKVDKETRHNLIMNVKAIFLHNIGSYCVFGTDNLLISSFVGLTTVGLYSNYTMITTQLASLLTPILNGIGASVGNLIATESKEKRYQIFNVMYLINFWIYSFSVIFLYNLLEPFINWWLGKGLLLDKLAFVFILFNFYLTGLRGVVTIFKSKAGIFTNDKYMPLIESIINLGTSIVLVKYFGLAGIFIGTTISTISIPLWMQPKLVYNKVFEKSVSDYFKKYIFYVILTLIVGIFATTVCNILVVGSGFMSLVLKGIICVVIVNISYLFVFYKTDEFKYILNIVKPMVMKMKVKISLN